MIPKILIIEGPDNCGKNFVINIINNIISENKSWCSPHVEYHCTKPKIPDNIKSSINKINYTINKYKDILVAVFDNFECSYNFVKNELIPEYIIFNRSWLGEYVYGNIYRDFNYIESDYIQDIIREYIINDCHYDKENFIYIQLTANTDWLQRNDDNKSLSNNKRELIELEQKRFNDIYNKIDYCVKYKLCTTSLDNDGNLCWKDKNELECELRKILNK